MLMQNVGVTNKERYGMLWYFLEWAILFARPKFCLNIFFNFSWDGCNNQEKLKTKVMQNFGRQIRCIEGDVQVAN